MATEGKTITCLAAICWEPKKPLTVEQIEVDPPKKGEVRIKIVATGVCHTDKYTWSGLDSEGTFPCIFGHEGAGVVESVGEGVTSVKIGDHVIPLYTPECRSCKFCTSGKTNLCSAIRLTQGKGLMPDGTSRFRCRGTPIFHYMGCSTFSQYTVLPEIAVAVIDSLAPMDKVCLLGCGIPTGYGAALYSAKVTPGSTVGVWGIGGVGLSVIQGAVKAGARMIVAIDTNPTKEEWAKRFGATHFINPKAQERPMLTVLSELTDGGFDYTFECVGHPATMREALEACHKGWGESTIIGVAASGTEIATRPFQLVTGRVWRGSAFGGVKGRTQLPEFVKLYQQGELKIDEYITQRFALSDINQAFIAMEKGESVRAIVYLHETPNL